MFTASWCMLIAKTWEQSPRPSAGEWWGEWWPSHTVEYSAAVLKNAGVLHESSWKNVHDKGVSGKWNKYKKQDMQFCQDSHLKHTHIHTPENPTAMNLRCWFKYIKHSLKCISKFARKEMESPKFQKQRGSFQLRQWVRACHCSAQGQGCWSLSW